MGKVYIKGSSSVYWNGPKYINWLIENKIETDPTYDYEVEQKNRALVVVNNLEKKKNG